MDHVIISNLESVNSLNTLSSSTSLVETPSSLGTLLLPQHHKPCGTAGSQGSGVVLVESDGNTYTHLSLLSTQAHSQHPYQLLALLHGLPICHLWGHLLISQHQAYYPAKLKLVLIPARLLNHLPHLHWPRINLPLSSKAEASPSFHHFCQTKTTPVSLSHWAFSIWMMSLFKKYCGSCHRWLCTYFICCLSQHPPSRA